VTPAARAVAPVFIVGGPRSGTAWLFHLLLSSGGFTTDQEQHEASPREQRRRAECSPDHLLQVEAIKAREPNALFLHIVRDGRDVACSLARHESQLRFGSTTSASAVLKAALYWEWMLRQGRQQIRRIGPDALEVRFEALVAAPRETLAAVGAFIAHDLDYDSIRLRGIGTVRAPNTAFTDEAVGSFFQPVGRWQRRLSIGRLARIEAGVGSLLEELGYALYTEPLARGRVYGDVRLRRSVAHYLFSAWHWMKTRTPLGRLSTSRLVADRGSHGDGAQWSPAPRKHTV
jgi:hypothetical protein